MDQAAQTMIDNLHKNTGKTLAQWIELVKSQHFAKHGEIMKYLKEQHGLTHGFANLIALKAREADAGSSDPDDLVVNQYKGKEHFKPLYDQLLSSIKAFGSDITVAPKKAYVSLRRKKQFVTLNPATKTRFEIGLNLKGQAPTDKLQAEKPNAMCSHKINLRSLDDIDQEVMDWIKEAYENAN